jgi:hypothetical protein
VAIDARNDGTFVDCAVAQLPASLGEEWAKSAHLGVSASTGQLADNHDVLSLVPQPSRSCDAHRLAAVAGAGFKHENKRNVACIISVHMYIFRVCVIGVSVLLGGRCHCGRQSFIVCPPVSFLPGHV